MFGVACLLAVSSGTRARGSCGKEGRSAQARADSAEQADQCNTARAAALVASRATSKPCACDGACWCDRSLLLICHNVDFLRRVLLDGTVGLCADGARLARPPCRLGCGDGSRPRLASSSNGASSVWRAIAALRARCAWQAACVFFFYGGGGGGKGGEDSHRRGRRQMWGVRCVCLLFAGTLRMNASRQARLLAARRQGEGEG